VILIRKEKGKEIDKARQPESKTEKGNHVSGIKNETD